MVGCVCCGWPAGRYSRRAGGFRGDKFGLAVGMGIGELGNWGATCRRGDLVQRGRQRIRLAWWLNGIRQRQVVRGSQPSVQQESDSLPAKQPVKQPAK